MSMIYDLDNEGGGAILSDSNTTQPALQVNSNAPGYPAVGIYSTASGAPIHAKTFGVSCKVESTLTGAVPALEVNSYAPGQSALNIASTASGYPIDVTAINATYGARFRSTVTAGTAVIIGKTVRGGPTIGALKFLGTSVASGAIMEFAGGFISCTSITIVSGGMTTDYAIPVSLNGVVRYIPLVQAGAIAEGAAF